MERMDRCVFPLLRRLIRTPFSALRGRAQRRGRAGKQGGADSFWSWREEMYELALSLTPESIFEVSRVAFRELYQAGVRTVGEFHYVHHDGNGAPFSDRTVMSDRVIEAARAEGLRISLLRVAYARAGFEKKAEGAQLRFVDGSVDSVLRDVETLRAKYVNDPDVKIGIAPHSVRAVSPEWIRDLAAHAAKHDLPFHMHVAEQTREIEECLAETGLRPVDLLEREGALGSRTTLVHATHLTEEEAAKVGSARAYACICATTERDLGDGLPNLGALRKHGARLCVGVDSHVICDPLEEMRSLELLERLRTEKRVTFEGDETPAASLFRSASHTSAEACGFADAGSTIAIDRTHASLALVHDEDLLDAIVFGGRADLFR